MRDYSDKIIVNIIIMLVLGIIWLIGTMLSENYVKHWFLSGFFVEGIFFLRNYILFKKATDWQGKIDWINYSHID